MYQVTPLTGVETNVNLGEQAGRQAGRRQASKPAGKQPGTRASKQAIWLPQDTRGKVAWWHAADWLAGLLVA